MVNVPVNSKTAHPPLGQTPGHLSFKEGQILHPVMPCTHEINEYKQNRLPLETSFNHALNKGIFHGITI